MFCLLLLLPFRIEPTFICCLPIIFCASFICLIFAWMRFFVNVSRVCFLINSRLPREQLAVIVNGIFTRKSLLFSFLLCKSNEVCVPNMKTRRIGIQHKQMRNSDLLLSLEKWKKRNEHMHIQSFEFLCFLCYRRRHRYFAVHCAVYNMFESYQWKEQKKCAQYQFNE